MSADYHLTKWRDEYWLVYIPPVFNGLGGLSAGDRPSSVALGFQKHVRGPSLRPEDLHKPPHEQRYDYFNDWYVRPLNRQIMAESTLYRMQWRGFPVQDPDWTGPTPQGDQLVIRMYPETWPMFKERGKAIEGMPDISKLPVELLNAPEEYYYRVVAPMMREDGWHMYDWRQMGLGGQTAKYIHELELIERPWPQDMIEGIKD